MERWTTTGSIALSAFRSNPLGPLCPPRRRDGRRRRGGRASVVFAAVAESGTSRGDRRPIGVIGAALDLGAGRRGVDMGPSAIRYAQLGERIEDLGLSIHDDGNVRTGMVEALDQGDPSARYWSAIKRTCEELADHVAATVSEGELPLVLGGDHSVAIGTMGGLARAHGAPGGVLWLDAHTDMNTPMTSPSGNVHGMPLAVALGLA